MKKKLIIGVAGMPGSGKATVVEIAKKLGYGIVIMGDEVREEAKRRDLAPTPENVGKVMLKLRKENGPAAVANRCIPKIGKMENDIIVVDGIRSLYEADAFKKHFSKFRLLAIHASPETRFKRIYKRRRSDDPAKWETFLERDWRELHVGCGNAVASADVMIINEGKKGDLKEKVQRFLENVAKNGQS